MNKKTRLISDDSGDFSANVGRNGDMATWYNYANGYRQAVKILWSQLTSSGICYGFEMLVFPLFFSARHSFELYIKGLIVEMYSLRKTGYTKNLFNHSLFDLWAALKNLLKKSDRRLKSREVLSAIEFLDCVIGEFNEFDKNSQVFRYPEDKSGNMHLADQWVIDVRNFSENMEQAYCQIDILLELIGLLVLEYRQGTYTENLSRNDLEDISSKVSISFSEIDEENKILIMKDYELSDSEFSAAISIIKSHRLFSSISGKPISLKYAKQEHFMDLISLNMNIWNKDENDCYTCDKSKYNTRGIKKMSELHGGYEKICHAFNFIETINHDIISDVCAVAELGMKYGEKRFCEEYENLLSDMLNMDKNLLAEDYIFKRSFVSNLKNGLKILGLSSTFPELC